MIHRVFLFFSLSLYLCLPSVSASLSSHLTASARFHPLLASLAPSDYHLTSLTLSSSKDSSFNHLTELHTLSTPETHPHHLVVHITTSFTSSSIRLHLTRNIDLITPTYKHIHWSNNDTIEYTPTAPITCYYHGRVVIDGKIDQTSRAAIHTCDGDVTGSFSTGELALSLDGAAHHYHVMGRDEEIHTWKGKYGVHVESTDAITPISSIPHIIYHSSSYQSDTYSCGVKDDIHTTDGLSYTHTHTHSHTKKQIHSTKFHTLAAPDCSNPNTVKYVEFFYINDNNRYLAYGSNVQSQTLAVANSLQSYYSLGTWSCKISIRLAGQITFTMSNPSDIAYYSCGAVDPRFRDGIGPSSPLYQTCCVNFGSGTTDVSSCPTRTWCAQSSQVGCQSVNSAQTATRNGKTFTTAISSTIVSTVPNEVGSSALLSSFNAFISSQRTRIETIFPGTKLDNAQLLTHTDFDGATVGLAPVGAMCSPDSSGAIIQADFTDPTYVGSISAHEMGHNFGMNHDTPGACTLTDQNRHYVMAASASSTAITVGWSSCSVDAINTWFSRTYQLTNRACLENDPSNVAPATNKITSACGNGIIEAGEVCDPGVLNTDTCCTSTCQLAPGCQCANSAPCCSQGQFVPASAQKVCRAAQDPTCDPAEMCDGMSGNCPNDVVAADDLECGSRPTGATTPSVCYRGKCMKSFAAICAAVPATLCTLDVGDMCSAYQKTANGQTGTVWCSSGTNSCRQASVSPPPDGTPCRMSGTTVEQCFCGVCGGDPTACRYSWKVGAFSTCTVVGATSTRTVTCVDTLTNAIADISQCDIKLQPSNSQICTTGTVQPSNEDGVSVGGTTIKMEIIIPVVIGAVILCAIFLYFIIRSCRSNTYASKSAYVSRSHGYGFNHKDEADLQLASQTQQNLSPSAYLPSAYSTVSRNPTSSPQPNFTNPYATPATPVINPYQPQAPPTPVLSYQPQAPPTPVASYQQPGTYVAQPQSTPGTYVAAPMNAPPLPAHPPQMSLAPGGAPAPVIPSQPPSMSQFSRIQKPQPMPPPEGMDGIYQPSPLQQYRQSPFQQHRQF